LAATAMPISFRIEKPTVATGRSKTCIGFHENHPNLFFAIEHFKFLPHLLTIKPKQYEEVVGIALI
jgi:hypothetical protein